MNPFIRLGLGLVLLLALLTAVSFALPQHISVVRSQVINAPEADIFPYLNDLRKFNAWSPWAARDPNAVYSYSGPAQGVGARMAWRSDDPDVGRGSQEIVESSPNTYLKVALEFGGREGSAADYTLEPSGAGTKVTWGFATDVGNNPVMRWMGLMFDGWVGADYEAGLKRLAQRVEHGGAP